MRIVCGMLVLLCAASASADDRLSPVQVFELRQEADALFAAGRMALALPLYERLSAANPGDGDLQLRLARALFASGSPAGLPLVEAALEEGFGNEPEVAYAIAQALAGVGQSEAALGWLEHALTAGLEDQAEIKSDRAFEDLHQDPRFRMLAGMLPAEPMTREQGWSHDLDFFLAEARASTRHPIGSPIPTRSRRRWRR